MELFRIVVVGMLLLIVFNLGTALYHLSGERGAVDADKSRRMLRALTWRIALSIGLLLLILFAWSQGWIHPHAVGG